MEASSHLSQNNTTQNRPVSLFSRLARYGFLVLIIAYVLGMILQPFVIGVHLFGAGSWGKTAHAMLGGAIIPLLALLLPLFGLLGRLPRQVNWMCALLFVITVLQVTLPFLRASVPLLSALHPLIAIFLFGSSFFLLRHVWVLMGFTTRK